MHPTSVEFGTLSPTASLTRTRVRQDGGWRTREALKQLTGEHARLRTRTETMYLDRLDGRITAAFFDQKSKEWREQQREIEGRMLKLETTVVRSATEAVQIMKSVSDTCARFPEAQPEQQRAIAMSLLKNATWKAGKLESALKPPFDVLALSNSVSQIKEREISGSGREIEIWLPTLDAFRTLAA